MVQYSSQPSAKARVLFSRALSFLLAVGAMAATSLQSRQIGDLAASDPRNIRNGLQIPALNYCDQPYVVVTTNGTWIVVMTTGSGHEGSGGQHIVSSCSTDQGRSWSPLSAIEPPDGPEASWVVPLLTSYGRIYAFYSYNGDQIHSMPGSPSRIRTDMLGWYCFKFSDDNGRSWSQQRYRIPLPVTACDLANQWGGKVQIFWGIDKPKVQNGIVHFAFTKLGRYMLDNGEGWIVTSDNLLTERDPDKLRFNILPEGDNGIRNPLLGSVQEEHNLVPLNGDDLFCAYRLNEQTPAQSYSRDGGHTWSMPERMTYTPGGRTFKHPRACPKLFKTANGNYLFWFHNHSGKSFESRNPVFLSGGTLHADGLIHWSEPEIILFDPSISIRMSYPDLIEQEGRFWITETQKIIARTHEIDPTLIQGLWEQAHNRSLCTNGLLTPADLDTFGTLTGRGLSLELLFNLTPDAPAQILFSKRDASGKGVSVTASLTDDDAPSLTISLSDGKQNVTWTTDPESIRCAWTHHLVFVCDFSARIISVVLDGRLCDGDMLRQYGWGRIPADLEAVAVTNPVTTAPAVRDCRLYARPLRTSEAVGNYRSHALPPLPTENRPARTVACWPLDAQGDKPLLTSTVNAAYSLTANKKAPGATNACFAAVVPNPDTSPRFAGDPLRNAGAIFFDSSRAGGYLTASNLGSRVEFNSSFTVEGWLCRTGDPGADLWYLCGAREIGAGWMLTLRRDGSRIGYHLHVKGQQIDTFFAGGTVTRNPGWHHLALVYDAQRNITGTWELFINGTSAGVLTNTIAPGKHGISTFNLGGRAFSAANTFNGIFDYWRVSSGARSPATFLYSPDAKGE